MQALGIDRHPWTPAHFATQKAQATKLLNLPVEGRAWYVIDFRWWTKWCAFIDAAMETDNFDAAIDDFPGPIDNTALLAADGRLKTDLLREEDITLIPEELWNLLVRFYGCVHSDTSVFKRTAVQTPSRSWIVEIYPPCFSFVDFDSRKFYFKGVYSESQTVDELKAIVREKLGLDRDINIRLFVHDGTAFEELLNGGVTIGEASLERKNTLYVKCDPGDPSGASPVNPHGTSAISVPLFRSTTGNHLAQYSGPKQTPGICGLSNLGNTCFMNSAIQCMSNVPQLTAYFLGDWKKDINKHNPIGTHGRIATAYAELIEHMWSGAYSYDVPRTLKREIALIANQFYGYAQHDSHELLVFLLDGLHEDLNRVVNKPYVEAKDAGDRPDEIVAAEAWANHKARNDSIIVDCFHGLLKSTVVCPTCKYRSVTFDPFASLNLPLPEGSKYYISVHVWPWTQTKTEAGLVRCEILITSVFLAGDLLNSLRQLRPCEPGCQYYLSEVYNRSLGRPLHPNYQFRDRYGPPLFAYELPPGELIPVRWHHQSLHNTSGWVGIPFYISIPPEMPNVSEVYLIRLIVSRLRAIGINDPPQPPTSACDPIAGDQQMLSDEPSTTSQNTQLSSTVTPSAMEDRSYPSASLHGDDDPIYRYLVNRIYLTDEHNQEVTDPSLDSDALISSFSRIFIDCSDGTLHPQLDSFMQSIVSSQRISASTMAHSRASINLSDCLERFVSVEKLSARDLWYCRRCKGEKQATKKFDLWSLPNVLVIQLKRFRSTLRSRDKIDSLVEFPLKGLDLTPWMVSNTGEQFVYDLIAVSNHIGYLYGGHYTAYALNEPTKRWFVFDDASTRGIDASQVVTSAAYVLVYQRREFHPQRTFGSPDRFSDHCLPCSDVLPDARSSGKNPIVYNNSGSISMYNNDDDLVDVE